MSKECFFSDVPYSGRQLFFSHRKSSVTHSWCLSTAWSSTRLSQLKHQLSILKDHSGVFQSDVFPIKAATLALKVILTLLLLLHHSDQGYWGDARQGITALSFHYVLDSYMKLLKPLFLILTQYKLNSLLANILQDSWLCWHNKIRLYQLQI